MDMKLCDGCGAPALPARGELVCVASPSRLLASVVVRLVNTTDLCGACLLVEVGQTVRRWIIEQTGSEASLVRTPGPAVAGSCVRAVVAVEESAENSGLLLRLACGHHRSFPGVGGLRPRVGDWVYCLACHDEGAPRGGSDRGA